MKLMIGKDKKDWGFTEDITKLSHPFLLNISLANKADSVQNNMGLLLIISLRS